MYQEISNPMDYHVALYIRLSKEDESEGPSQSVTNQQSLLDEFARKHRLQVYDTYIDDGWSGTSQKSGCDTFPCWTVSTPAWSPQPTTLRRSGPS